MIRQSKGDYRGGSTTLSGKDTSWFSAGSTALPPDERAEVRPRPPSEQAKFEAFRKESSGPPYTLIKGEERIIAREELDQTKNGKKRMRKSTKSGPKPKHRPP